MSEPALYSLLTFHLPNLCPFSSAYVVCPKNPYKSETVLHYVTSLFFLRRVVFSPTPNPKAEGPHLGRCPRLLVQYIRRYLSYLEAIPSFRNVRTLHAVVAVNPLHMGPPYPSLYYVCSYYFVNRVAFFEITLSDTLRYYRKHWNGFSFTCQNI
jgi:hypothetical protein